MHIMCLWIPCFWSIFALFSLGASILVFLGDPSLPIPSSVELQSPELVGREGEGDKQRNVISDKFTLVSLGSLHM